MIPTDPTVIDKLKKLAARNIANGDWGDEVSPPGEELPLSPKELNAKHTIKHILSENGDLRLPKKS